MFGTPNLPSSFFDLSVSQTFLPLSLTKMTLLWGGGTSKDDMITGRGRVQTDVINVQPLRQAAILACFINKRISSSSILFFKVKMVKFSISISFSKCSGFLL